MKRSERVLEARRMLEAGEFERAVAAQEPLNVLWDKLILECGHWTAWSQELFPDQKAPARISCDECAEAWIKAEGGK